MPNLKCPYHPGVWLRVEPGHDQHPDRLMCLACGCRFQVMVLDGRVTLSKYYGSVRGSLQPLTATVR